jgi:phage replication O-like protein O
VQENPQLEDGYTRLANELFDAILAFPFSGRQLKVVMTIIRKTYGYNKKRDDMSASQIANVCGMARPHVVKTLGELAGMNVIVKQSGKFGSLIEINKKYMSWGSTELVSPSTELVSRGTESVHVPKQYSPSTESVQVASTESVHTKDNLPKDNQQKTLAPSERISLDADGVWINIPDALMANWEQAYPALSLEAELSKAAAWIIANPKNKKSNYARFLTNWLTRAQDSAPRRSTNANSDNRPKLVY